MKNHSLFYIRSKIRKVIVLVVFIDIIITRNDLEERIKLKKELMKEFFVKDLGQISTF